MFMYAPSLDCGRDEGGVGIGQSLVGGSMRAPQFEVLALELK